MKSPPDNGKDITGRPQVLVLGQHNRQVLAIVHSLHAAGYHTVLGRADSPSPTEMSRSVDEVWRHPPLHEGTAAFLEALDRLHAERSDLGAIFPSGDLEVAALSDLAGALPKDLTIVMPTQAAVRACQDKVGTMAIAAAQGVPVAPYLVATDLIGLHDAIGQIGFPVIVKPSRPLHTLKGRKAIVCHDIVGAETHFPEWPAGHDRLVVQEYVPGHLIGIQFAAKSGAVLSAFQIDTLRSDWPDGVGHSCSFVTAPLSPRLLDCTARIVKHLDYTGVGAIQFHGDEHGRVTFLELNPRQSALAEFSRTLGEDFPIFALELAMGRKIANTSMENGYPIGVHGSSIHLDLYGMRRAYRQDGIDLLGAARWSSAAVASLFRAQTDLMWHWRDPLPGLVGFVAPRRNLRKTFQT